MSLLIVDHHAESLRLLADLLEGEGAETRTTTRAADALTMMQSRAPDVIVSDLTLPAVEEFAFLRAVRRDPLLQQTPAIAITGSPETQSRVVAQDAGFDRLLIKPVDFDAIVAEIVRMVAVRRRGGGS